MGSTLIARSFSTASTSSGSVSGVPSMPACSKSSVLYQMPVMPNENGIAYCAPSTSHGLTTPPNSAISAERSPDRSLR